jgi:polyisoprenoid-binding protein YceI
LSSPARISGPEPPEPFFYRHGSESKMRKPPMPALLAAAVAIVAALAPAPARAASTFAVDPGHSDVSFQIRHLMSKVRGVFRDVAGTIVRDDQDPSNSSVELTIQAASIDTRNESRDEDLRGPNFFDVEKFPVITFKSTRVERVSDSEYRVTGRLEMHGVDKEVTLPVTFDGEMEGRVGYSLATKLDRKEFGISWNRALDNGGYLLSDEVDVAITIEAKRK